MFLLINSSIKLLKKFKDLNSLRENSRTQFLRNEECFTFCYCVLQSSEEQ